LRSKKGTIMLVQILLLLVGLALVVFGADYLVDGASAVARRFGLSEFVIGLTIVGMGTSAPEMVVSFIGAAQGNADIAIGNVVGSNIFNTMLILGLTALLLPMDITRENRKKDIPVNILITVLLIVLGLELTFFGFGTDGLSRIDGAILVALFVAYIWSSFAQKTPEAQPESESKPIKPWLAVIMILGGLGGLVAGGKLFLNSATAIAHALGVSDKFIAITILAGGTSLPELATSLVAAIKKEQDIAIGNVVGSNIFNLGVVTGVPVALFGGIPDISFNYVDLAILVGSAIVLFIFARNDRRITRREGAVLLSTFVIYYSYVIVSGLN
jgi:cation:H+ antiporter